MYFKMLNNPSLLRDILSVLYRYTNAFIIRFETSQCSLLLLNFSEKAGTRHATQQFMKVRRQKKQKMKKKKKRDFYKYKPH